jgi:exopolysaccharide production protein ExoQ
MGSTLALFVFIVGITGLFFLDRDKSVRTSKALWLPVIWLWINGSRSISAWLGNGPQADSTIDQFMAGILILFSIVVLGRRSDVIRLLRRSWPIALYFSYSLVSALWSDFPTHSLTRWLKSLGDLLMVLILVTDAQPVAAIRRFFSYVGFVLLPASVFLLKYFPDLSHAYDPWGRRTNTGVTTDKNMLGVVTLVLALGAFWQIFGLLRDGERAHRTRHLLAQSALVYCGMTLLIAASSATSGACFALGSGLIILTSRPIFRNRPVAIHALVFAIILVGGLTVLLGGQGAAAEAMGRDAHFHGRTEVWELLIPMAPNPIVGAGFETFWFGPRLEKLWLIYPGVNEAHNGYLEVYLNLGLLGLGLILLLFAQGYRSTVAAFRRDPALGSLLVAIVLTAAIYSVTEAGFRMLDPIWFVLLLAIVAASRVTDVGKGLSRLSQDLTEPTLGEQPRSPRPQRNLDEQLKPCVFLECDNASV